MRSVVAAAVFCCLPALCLDHRMESLQGSADTPATLLRVLARDYIRRASTPEAEVKWNAKFSSRVATRVQDSGLSEEQAAHEIFQDWAASNRKYIEDPSSAPAAVILEACRFVSWLTDRSMSLPSKLYSSLTHEHVEMIRKAVAKL